MKNKTLIKDISCPVERTIEVIGDKWSILILRELFLNGGSRKFKDFSDALTGISPNLLSTRIKKLCEYDVLESRVYSEHPPRNEYVLTEKGQDIGSIVQGLRSWGNKHTKEN